jgi:type I restriction enzyme, S subunit
VTMNDRYELPASWCLVTLAEVVSPNRPRHQPSAFPDLPFVGMEHVEAHSMRLTGTVPSSSMKSSAVHFFPGDVFYGRLRPYLNKVFQPDFEGLCSAEFIVFPPGKILDSRFLKYMLYSADFVSFASHLNEGDRPRVDFNQIGTYQAPIPPLPEQRRIVAEVETQFTRLEAAVAALALARANLKRYRTIVITDTLSGRTLGNCAAVTFSEGNPMAIPVPVHWGWATLAEVSSLKGGITKGNRRIPGTKLRVVPYLRVANVQRGWLDLREIKTIEATEDEINALRLQHGDVLFNEGGDRDKLGRGWVWEDQIVECIHQNHVFRARVKPGTLLPKFLSHYANAFGQPYFMREGKQTTNLASINLTKLGALPVPVPPIDEQVRIVDEVERQLSVCADIESALSANLNRAERLRQAILRQAFAGQLVPQNPDDEPATVLLERIRTERAMPLKHHKPGSRRQSKKDQYALW